MGPAAAESMSASNSGKAAKPVYPLSVAGPKPEPIAGPPAAEIRASIKKGVRFLLETQLEMGAWGKPENGKYYRIWAPIPGAHRAFRTATTGLALQALVESRELYEGEFREKVEQAIDRGQDWLLDNGVKLRRSAPDSYDDFMGYALYNVWGHAYAIHGGLKLLERADGNSELEAKLRHLVQYQIERLADDEFVNGGWGYYDEPLTDKYGRPSKPRRPRMQTPTGSSISFTTATVLIALKQAEEAGFEIPAGVTQPAVDSVVRQRYPDFAYAYGEYLKYMPRRDINRPAGSLGRSQACNLALRMYGDELVSDKVLETWLDRLIARNGWLSMSRKRNYPGQSPHYADFGVAGYFYYYGHYYAALCTAELPADQQPFYQKHLANILLPLQEKDGSWWDYILYDYHQQYGTSMAISTLVCCLPHETP